MWLTIFLVSFCVVWREQIKLLDYTMLLIRAVNKEWWKDRLYKNVPQRGPKPIKWN